MASSARILQWILTGGRLSSSAIWEFLMDEAFNRSQTDLHVVRYTLPIDANAEPEDTLKNYQVIQSVYDALKTKTSASEITKNINVKYVDMGYVTVFALPYVYENIVYGLKQGEFSKPYKSRKAWHIFQVVDQRKSAGKWKVAQILFTSPENADDATKANARKLADSVYGLLQNGSEFGAMARQYSDDKLTYLSGGEMPEFGTGKFDIEFEREVVKLKTDNEFSAPFNTSFGIHIIKRLSFTPTPTTKDDETFQFDLKQKLMQDERMKIARDKFANDILSKIGFKQSSTVSPNDLFRLVDTVMNNTEDMDIASKTSISNKVIISYSKGNIKGEDWLIFARDYKANPELYKEETNAELWEKYKIVASLDYYRKHLESFNTEFANQLQEFKEGNLLFEIMEKNVWSKASSDSVGLRAYYNAHKNQYIWSKSADVLIMNAVSDEIAKAAKESIQNGVNWKELVEVNQGELQGDSGRFELTQINADSTASEDSYSPVTLNSDGTAGFMKYLKFYKDGEQRSFEDARGMVINDYQGVVEKRWLSELQKKYPVKINESLLKEIIQKQ